MRKLLIIIALLGAAQLSMGAAINVTNTVTITANTNVQQVLKNWLDANVPGAGGQYVARFSLVAGEQLTNWIKRIYKDQIRLEADTAAQATIQSNQIINPVGP